MTQLLDQLINGLSLGSVYLLLVTGFNLVLLVARVVHVAYPHTVVLAMYAAWYGLDATGDSIVFGILAALLAAILVNLALNPIFSRLSRRGPDIDINTSMVVSLAVGLVIVELLSHAFNNGFPVAFPPGILGNRGINSSAAVHLTIGQALTFAVAILLTATLFLLLYRSRWGRAARAISDDPAAARLAGVPIGRTQLTSYFLGGTIAGTTAIVLATLLGSASASLADMVSIKALAVSIIAGLGNLTGGIVIALALGILEALAQGYIGGAWANSLALVVLLLVLLARPNGIFGSRV